MFSGFIAPYVLVLGYTLFRGLEIARNKSKSFTHENAEYDLAHVHPFEWEFTAPAAVKRPERTYRLQVTFSMPRLLLN